jgi:hypothetical protein
MSYPPAGTCLVHQTSGEASFNLSLRGVLPSSASLTPQPTQLYNNGTQSLTFSPGKPYFSSTLGGTLNSMPFAMNQLGANESFTIDPAGANQVLAFTTEPPPGWVRPNAILAIPR